MTEMPERRPLLVEIHGMVNEELWDGETVVMPDDPAYDEIFAYYVRADPQRLPYATEAQIAEHQTDGAQDFITTHETIEQAIRHEQELRVTGRVVQEQPDLSDLDSRFSATAADGRITSVPRWAFWRRRRHE